MNNFYPSSGTGWARAFSSSGSQRILSRNSRAIVPHDALLQSGMRFASGLRVPVLVWMPT